MTTENLRTLIMSLKKAPNRRDDREISLMSSLLETIEFFKSKNLSLSHLNIAARYLTYGVYLPGQNIIKYGKYGDTFYIILKGSVSILVPVKVKEEDEDIDDNKEKDIIKSKDFRSSR